MSDPTPNSLPVLRRELTLHSLTSIKTYQRTYERMEWLLYLADVLVRVRGQASRRFDQEIDQVIAAIESCLTQVETSLKDTRRYYENRLRKAGIDMHSHELDYSHPLIVVLQTRTPLGRRYIQLLANLDRVAQRIDQAWYHGLINARKQLDAHQKLYFALLRTTRRVSILALGLAQRVQDADSATASIDANYANILVSRVGSAPSDESPLELSNAMSAEEQAELAESQQLATALTVSLRSAELETSPAYDAENAGHQSEDQPVEANTESPAEPPSSRGFARLSRVLSKG